MLIGTISNNNLSEATYRITIQSLTKSLIELGHTVCDVSELTDYPDILFGIRHIDPDIPELKEFIINCKNQGTKICCYINDVYRVDDSRLRAWANISDIIFTPTKYHKLFIESICDNRVEILPDSIDYQINTPYNKKHINKEKLKVCWFGYPESYSKSMGLYHPIIEEFINQNEIEYTIISKGFKLPQHINFLEFNNNSFCDDLKQFDLCILSHAPLDYNINTFVKSPNKLSLAISLGVPCIVSKTPSYRDLLKECFLEEYCFSSLKEFKELIIKMKNPNVRNKYLEKSQDIIINKFNYKNIGKIFLQKINK
jgi:glycosyltransferase involved in cell wall biosynthesis